MLFIGLRKFAIFCLTITTLFSFLLIIIPVQAQYTWDIDEEGYMSMDIGAYHSLALDSNNNPHIAFWDNTLFAEDARYGNRVGGSWTYRTVDDEGYTGKWPSIAVDSNNYPHITYKNDEGYLEYARWDGTTWQKEIIGATSGQSDLALDSNDNPHISYHRALYDDLYYATFDGTTWRKEEMVLGDNLLDVGFHNSIAVDSNNNPHISHYQEDNGRLTYSYYDGSEWNSEYVDTDIMYGGLYTSIVVDSNNNPHISYYGFNTFEEGFLKYAWKIGGTWIREFVDNPTIGDAGLYTSIAVDSNNNPHISYYTDSPWSVKYATKRSTWSTFYTETVANLEPFNVSVEQLIGRVYSDISLDSSDNPHILFVDLYWGYGSFNWYLKYATAVSGGPVPPPEPPLALFSAPLVTGLDFGASTKSCTFDPSASSDSDGTIELYEWDLNDDGIYNNEVPSSSSEDSVSWGLPEGVSRIKLRVTDNNSLTDIQIRHVVVLNALSWFMITWGTGILPLVTAWAIWVSVVLWRRRRWVPVTP